MTKEGVYVASLIEELIEVLEEETGCYELLLEMANNKKDVIIEGELPSLQEMTKQEQELAGLLLRLEKKRSNIVDDICLVTNKDSKDMTVSKLIKLLDGQKEEQNRLIEVTNRLVKNVEALRGINKSNNQLLKQSLDFIDFTLNAIQSSREPITNSGYQKKGEMYRSTSENNFFDAKQ